MRASDLVATSPCRVPAGRPLDPEQFHGTAYTAQDWQEPGLTDGFGRYRRDFYVAHDKPKRLFAREVVRNARTSSAA